MLVTEMPSQEFLHKLTEHEEWADLFLSGEHHNSKDNLFVRERHLSNITLDNRSLMGAYLVGCFFRNVTFQQCNFRSSDLFASTFEDCSFIKCDFYKAELKSGNYIRANFTDSSCVKTDFSYSNLMHANFTNCDLSWAWFLQSDLRFANWENTNLHGTRMAETKLYSTQKFHVNLTEKTLIENVFWGLGGRGETSSKSEIIANLAIIPNSNSTNIE